MLLLLLELLCPDCFAVVVVMARLFGSFSYSDETVFVVVGGGGAKQYIMKRVLSSHTKVSPWLFGKMNDWRKMTI